MKIKSLYICVDDMQRAIDFYTNCLPSIEVDSIETLKRKIEKLEICFPLTKIDNNYVVEFIDSEGNHIELTTKVEGSD